jgi:hypothetical protein
MVIAASDGTFADNQTITITVTDAADGTARRLLDLNNSMYIPGIPRKGAPLKKF